MNISAVGASSAVQSATAAEVLKPQSTPAPASAPSTPTDTVSLSSSAHSAPATTHDVDRDGDSH